MNIQQSISKLDLPFLAWAQIDDNCIIENASLNWHDFGFENIVQGIRIDEVISALWGVFPTKGNEDVALPLVISDNGKFLDFTIRTLNKKYMIFALDVTTKAIALQELQQVRNELEFLTRDIYKVFPDKPRLLESENHVELVQQTKNLIYTSRLAALGEMASGLSHEINNPLMIIQGGIEFVEKLLRKKSEFSGTIADIVTRSKIAINRIVYLINGLKNFARQDQDFTKEAVPLSTIIDEAFVFCSEMLKMHNINLYMDKVPQITLNCRPLQISQVLFNLIKNADEVLEKETDKNHKWIRISFKETPTDVFVYVSNGGNHIPLTDQGKIFQPFFTTKDVGEGVGMGLSISRGIMQEHEGELIFDWNAPDTTFILKIPVESRP
jgi:C4-dicarboxylate-specific signal transduction histidine kinase